MYPKGYNGYNLLITNEIFCLMCVKYILLNIFFAVLYLAKYICVMSTNRINFNFDTMFNMADVKFAFVCFIEHCICMYILLLWIEIV